MRCIVLHSPLIPPLHVCVATQGKLYIITEYAGGGNLHDYIKQSKTKLPEEFVWKMFVQVVCCGRHRAASLHDFVLRNVLLLRV